MAFPTFPRSLDDVESILQHVDVSPESTVSLRGEYEGLVMHRVKLKSHLKDIESVIKTAKSTQEPIKQMLEVLSAAWVFFFFFFFFFFL
jgi:hypothetical protein